MVDTVESPYKDAMKTGWRITIITFILLLVALYFIRKYYWYIPKQQLYELLEVTNPQNAKEIIQGESSIRAGLAQILLGLVQLLGGTALIVGLYFTWLNIRIAQENLKVAQRTADNNLHTSQETLRLTRESQITERFARTVEQLERKELHINLAAIYTLEQIAINTTQYHWPIMEILTAYVRQKTSPEPARIDNQPEDFDEPPEIDPEGELDLNFIDAPPNPPSINIQTILTVLGRRKHKNEAEDQRLDLRRCNLPLADLIRGHFNNANLSWSDLSDINADGALFEGASLKHAELRYAKLKQANLQRADLSGAILRNAKLQGAQLQGANLSKADMSFADLAGADLSGANLTQAYLSSIDLRTVRGLNQEQLNSAFINEHTQLPANLQRPQR